MVFDLGFDFDLDLFIDQCFPPSAPTTFEWDLSLGGPLFLHGGKVAGSLWFRYGEIWSTVGLVVQLWATIVF